MDWPHLVGTFVGSLVTAAILALLLMIGVFCRDNRGRCNDAPGAD